MNEEDQAILENLEFLMNLEEVEEEEKWEMAEAMETTFLDDESGLTPNMGK